MSKKTNKCMFIGLPNSGKSSFIGALWHVVETDEIDTAYSIVTQPEDREYLNSLRESFLSFKAPERTKTDYVKKIELSIKDNSTNKTIDFVFPDLSGETFVNQYTYRKISKDYISQIEDCNGIILFINPDHLKKSNLITDTIGMFDDDDDSSNPELSKDQDPIRLSEPIIWTHEMSQTQVVLVDILQMIKKKVIKPCKIAVVISAWDLIKDMPDEVMSSIIPNEWLLKELPLLHQFLNANHSNFSYETFGVSAQGTCYKLQTDTTKFSELQAILNQSERIKVQYKENISSDITLPIKWLLNGQE